MPGIVIKTGYSAGRIFAACCFFIGAAHAAEERPGAHYDIRPQDMPAPYATQSVANAPRVVDRPDGATLTLPPGFTATLFADDLSHARWLAVAENGDVFLAESRAGKITLLRDADGDGKAELVRDFATGFSRPHGMVFRAGTLYVGDTESIWTIPYTVGDLQARARERLAAPNVFGPPGNHWTRNLAFDRNGTLYVSVGSAGNVAEEPSPRATIQRVDREGRLSTFASGLRNPVGIAFYPGTDDLYTVVNERDGLGDGLVPDYFTRVREGGFYGWPYAYIGNNPDPDYGEKRPDLVARTIVPDVLFEAHSAALGLVFYTAEQFPSTYRGGAFVSLHGSWNSNRPTGYKVVYVPFRGGRPAGGYDDFALGFRAGGEERAEVWGRPVGLAVARDGSLLVADDAGNAVWRITYTGK